MKNKLILAVTLSVFIYWAQAQTTPQATLYGYKQPVISGAQKSGDVQEGGAFQKSKNSTSYTYFIYLTSAATRLYPAAIWINGQPFGATSEAVEKTPVENVNHVMPSHPRSVVLVPKTSQKVWKLTPIPPVDNKSAVRAQALAKNNELVVMYKLKGKFNYVTLKKLTVLEAEALQ